MFVVNNFLLFIILSFLGWLMEEVLGIIKNKKIPNRGFLIGPICPIYGIGGLLMIFLLEKYENDLLALFIMATILGAVLEYFTSYIMEKLFKVRWWDYSNRKYNINGRICLYISLLFGLLGVITIHVLKPFFMGILNMMPNVVLIILFILILGIFITDLIVSCNTILKIHKVDLSGARDATEEISKRVKRALEEHSILTRRLIHAFPNLNIDFHKRLEKLKKSKNV